VKRRRSQPRPCDLCSIVVAVRFRIQYDARQRWVLACPACQQHHSRHSPHYRYGGTWKARAKT